MKTALKEQRMSHTMEGPVKSGIRVENLSVKLDNNINRVILLPFNVAGEPRVGIVFECRGASRRY